MSKGERVTQVIRIAAFVISILLWAGSVIFSVDGFAFQMPKYIWIGYAMAAAITIIELVFNEEGFEHNLTIIALSGFAYLYDIGTNIVGIWVAQGSANIGQNPAVIIWPVLFGIFLAIAPEPLMVWAVAGSGARDLLSHLFGDEVQDRRPQNNNQKKWQNKKREDWTKEDWHKFRMQQQGRGGYEDDPRD